MNRPQRRFNASLSIVRELLGTYQEIYSHAVEIRSEKTDLRELVAATAICHQLEEGIAKCREHISAVRLETGWDRPARRQGQKASAQHRQRRFQRQSGADHPAPDSAVASALTASLVEADRRTAGRRPPAEDGDALGVVGAQPPPAMGHGWPASPGAGSAAGICPEAGNASQLAEDQVLSPGDAFFRPVSERISR